jgi:hypothetical protein
VEKILDRIDGIAARLRGGGAPSRTRRTALLILGWLVLVAGAALVPLPGPGLPFVALGLSMLAGNHAWARSALSRLRASLSRGRAAPQPQSRGTGPGMDG